MDGYDPVRGKCAVEGSGPWKRLWLDSVEAFISLSFLLLCSKVIKGNVHKIDSIEIDKDK